MKELLLMYRGIEFTGAGYKDTQKGTVTLGHKLYLSVTAPFVLIH